MYGLVFGIGSPIPGLSAGSLAVILNVYDTFFRSVSVAYIKKNWTVTVVFLVGWGAGLIWISGLFMYLFGRYWDVVIFSFMGLIAGSLPLIYKKATQEPLRGKSIVICVLALACMLFLAFGGGDLNANRTLEQIGGITTGLLAWLFAAGFISSAAMMIPGVGGSLMMLAFGIYALYIEAVSTLHPLLLSVFGVSMVLGVLAGIALTKKLLISHAQALYFAILGFVAGSLFIMYPGLPMNAEGLLSVVLAAGSAALAYWLSMKEKNT